jgi:hypothetical protein
MDSNLAEVIQTMVVASGLLIAFSVFMLTRRRAAKPDPQQLDLVLSRLQRIEEAVDAIAIEVERVSEGQRFTAKVLAEKAAEQLPLRVPPKQTTPH